MTEFDRGVARRVVRLMQLADERWRMQYASMQGQEVSSVEHSDEVQVLLHGYAVEMLMWARGLDDWCRGKGTCDALAGYEQARENVRGLIEGARYVTNHAVHQLADLSRVATGFSVPFSVPLKFDKLAAITWVTKAFLPLEAEEHDDTQRRFRQQYVEHLSGRSIDTTMTALLSWFEEQLRE